MLHEKLDIYQHLLVDAAVWVIEPPSVCILMEVIAWVQSFDMFSNARPGRARFLGWVWVSSTVVMSWSSRSVSSPKLISSSNIRLAAALAADLAPRSVYLSKCCTKSSRFIKTFSSTPRSGLLNHFFTHPLGSYRLGSILRYV